MTRFLCRKPLLCLFCLLLTVLLSACSGSDKDSALPLPVEIDLEQQLQELEDLPLPEGVDRALWAELKQSLALLLQQKSKAVQAAPGTDASATSLHLNVDATQGFWLYFNQGDYDQNGEVNISDITPIAQNFGESNEGNPFPTESALSVVDGDGNGEINIADLTPIGLNFGVRVGSYNIYTSASAEDYPADNSAANGEGSEFVSSVQLAMASGEPANTRLALSFELPEPLPVGFIWLRPCDTPDGTGQLGTPSNLVAQIELNRPPVASITYYTFAIHDQPPVLQTYDLSASHDPDGVIVNYELDLDGDGVYEQSSTVMPDLAEHNFTEAGLYHSRLRVTDNDGAQDTDEMQVSIKTSGNVAPQADLATDVAEGDAPLTVNFDASGSADPDGNISLYDFDLDGDFIFEILGTDDPTQSFTYENGGQATAYLRVTDDSGAQAVDAEIIQVSNPNNLLPVADLTADVSSGEAPLAVSLDASGSFDTDGSIVEYRWDLGGDGDTDFTTEEPFLDFSFHREGSQTVQVFVEDSDGGVSAPDSLEIVLSDGWEVQTVAISVNAIDVDLVVADIGGQDFEPLISYSENGPNSGDLTIRNGIAQATSFSSGTLVDGSVDTYDLELISGRPAVAFESGELYYLRADNAAGTAWPEPMELDEAFGSGTFGIDMEVVDGNPAITYNNVSNPTQYIRALDADGATWNFSTLTGLDFDGIDPKMLDTGARPLIVANEYHSGNFLLFSGTDAQGSSFNVEPVISQSDGTQRDFTLALLGGRPALAYAFYGRLYLQVAADSAGSAWNEPQLLVNLMPLGGLVRNPRLRTVSGLPALGFALNSGQAWYMQAEDALGESWGEAQLIDADNAGAADMELASYLGRPAIVYCNGSGGLVKFAYLRE